MTPYQLSHLSTSNSTVKALLGHYNAVRLANLNARTSTICALTGMPPSKVKQIVIAINSRTTPRGRGIENLEEYINNKKHRRHVSFIIQNYRRGINFGLSHLESIIESYLLYQETFSGFTDKRSFVDIDHAYVLIQETNKKIDYDLSECACCKSRFFYYKYELPLTCPFCTDVSEQKQQLKHGKTVVKKAA